MDEVTEKVGEILLANKKGIAGGKDSGLLIAANIGGVLALLDAIRVELEGIKKALVSPDRPRP